MSHHESQAPGADGRMVDRMLFFSDAVFAIVLTIMVLELQGPVLHDTTLGAQSSAALWQAIGSSDLPRTFFAYLISFAIVGLWWSVHMRVTRSLHRFDWPTAIFNLVFLLTVTLVPFGAAMLGQHISNPASWVLYWGINAGASFSLTVLMIVVSRNKGFLLGGMSGTDRAARILQSIGPGIGFAVGAWLAATNHLELSRFCWLIIMPVMAVARLLHRKAVAAQEKAPAA